MSKTNRSRNYKIENKLKYRKEVEPIMKRIAALVLAFALLLVTPALADMDLTGYSIANGNVSAVNYVDIVAPIPARWPPLTWKPAIR